VAGASSRECPVCKGPADPAARWRPFCSDRCRLLDLGAWMKGDYTVSRPMRPADLGEDPEGDDGA
jgi:endogenous inhibitor of DNA gyrase (YacG/DUF329 family)